MRRLSPYTQLTCEVVRSTFTAFRTSRYTTSACSPFAPFTFQVSIFFFSEYQSRSNGPCAFPQTSVCQLLEVSRFFISDCQTNSPFLLNDFLAMPKVDFLKLELFQSMILFQFLTILKCQKNRQPMLRWLSFDFTIKLIAHLSFEKVGLFTVACCFDNLHIVSSHFCVLIYFSLSCLQFF